MCRRVSDQAGLRYNYEYCIQLGRECVAILPVPPLTMAQINGSLRPRRVHRVVFVDFKNHLFRADLGFFALHIQPRAPRLWRLEFAKLTKARAYAYAQLKDRSERAAPPARPCTSIVDVYTRARAVPVCQYNSNTVRVRVRKILLVHEHTCRTTWRLRAGTGKLLIFFCMRRNRGSVVLLPTTILALETARGLGR